MSASTPDNGPSDNLPARTDCAYCGLVGVKLYTHPRGRLICRECYCDQLGDDPETGEPGLSKRGMETLESLRHIWGPGCVMYRRRNE